MELSTTVLLITGFSLGLVHAFDADHVMAVTGLAQKRRNIKATAWFCARWALGHGAVVLALAFALLAFDWQMSAVFVTWVERSVGLLLIAIGGILLAQVIKPKIVFTTHKHGDIEHTHLVHAHKKHEDHVPVLVGIVHGVAGSAPLLAILPNLFSGSTLLGLVYVLLFSLGVLSSMLGFGWLLGRYQAWLQGRGARALGVGKLVLAFASIVLGAIWLTQ